MPKKQGQGENKLLIIALFLWGEMKVRKKLLRGGQPLSHLGFGMGRAAAAVPTLPVGVFVGIMPCVIRIGAIPILTHLAMLIRAIFTTAPTARRILTPPALGRFGLWLRLIGPSRWPHVLGEGFLAGDPCVVIMIVVHCYNITHKRVFVKG
jgi:hypothetical protein